jgi:hypothetical protein
MNQVLSAEIKHIKDKTKQSITFHPPEKFSKVKFFMSSPNNIKKRMNAKISLYVVLINKYDNSVLTIFEGAGVNSENIKTDPMVKIGFERDIFHTVIKQEDLYPTLAHNAARELYDVLELETSNYTTFTEYDPNNKACMTMHVAVTLSIDPNKINVLKRFNADTCCWVSIELLECLCATNKFSKPSQVFLHAVKSMTVDSDQ